MTNRRNFLKQMTLLGAAAVTPVSLALGQNESPAEQAEQSDGLFTVPRGEILRNKSPRKITIPDVEEFRILKGDFHIHTIFSDGFVMPKDRITEAVDNGLDVIAITDHIEYRPHVGGNGFKLLEKNDDHNMAYNIAKPEAEKQNLILVRGTEITKSVMPPGHFNALFLEDVNPVAVAVENWKTMLAVAAGQGGFVHWNHPGWVAPGSGGLRSGEMMRFTQEHEDVFKKGHLHGIEVFNGSSYYPVVSEWCEDRNLALIANSDVHSSEWNMYGHQNPLRPMTLILAKERTYDAVREAFFANRTVVLAAGMIIGRPEWVEKLFKACVEVTGKPGLLELKNKSDIPCFVQAGGTVRELAAQARLSLYRSHTIKKLTVCNWLTGMNKPLEIAVG
ncbi:MAG: twin-arginine translocation signal domain-containing protein [Planctomycetaceae bacterium]|jgi:histidinol phosphatase-like PHP family hydrolase|nr:twin-arginine translocation signal domain-containing protein [Planctomycetaceae bacterium]